MSYLDLVIAATIDRSSAYGRFTGATQLPGFLPGFHDGCKTERMSATCDTEYRVCAQVMRCRITAPYMHDGRFATLEEVIDHYNSGFTRNETLDPNLAKHPQGLGLADADKKALVAFLKALSDPKFVTKDR